MMPKTQSLHDLLYGARGLPKRIWVMMKMISSIDVNSLVAGIALGMLIMLIMCVPIIYYLNKRVRRMLDESTWVEYSAFIRKD
jgi:hypothetical protein